MKYLKKFESHSDYELFIVTDKPNVSYCVAENEVHYNPIVPPDYSQEYLTFIAKSDGTFQLSTNAVNYSLDNGTTWTELAAATASPTVTAGSKIMWKATDLTPTSGAGIGTFSSTVQFDVEGNPMSLLYGDDFKGQTALTGKDNAFRYLFSGCTNVVSAKNMSLSATTLAQYCYRSMFYGCTSLTTAPELPATTLISYCYNNMFQNCASLTTAPELPATTLASSCYYGMFQGCTSLTTAPALPATTLAYYCYNSMFRGCTSLNYIKCLATDISASNCTNKWVTGVASSGTFVKAASMTSWTTGANGIPSGWTPQNAA